MTPPETVDADWEQVRVVAKVAAPVAATFAVVSDFTTWPAWVMGLKSLEATSEQTRGVGTELESVTDIGPLKLKNKGQVVTCEHDKEFAIEAGGAISVRAAMQFSAPSPDETELSVAVNYRLPGGLHGRALARLIPPFLTVALRHSETQLSKYVEERHHTRAIGG